MGLERGGGGLEGLCVCVGGGGGQVAKPRRRRGEVSGEVLRRVSAGGGPGGRTAQVAEEGEAEPWLLLHEGAELLQHLHLHPLVELVPGVPMSGLGGTSSVSGRPLEGWLVASRGLAALPRTRGSTLAHGCGREGSGALPLPRAAAVSTG